MTMTMQDVADLFVPIEDFPHKGVKFFNLNDLTKNPMAFKLTMNELEMRCREWMKRTGTHIDVIAGFDARGFIPGSVIADRLGVGFVMLRKKGKLPPVTIGETYTLEYGEATLEVNEDDLTGQNVVLMDDLLATGGTAEAGFKLIERLGGTPVMFMAITDIPGLGGRKKLQKYAVETLLTVIDGELKADVRYCVDAVITDKDTGKLVLIDRLSTPVGYAMAGGGIELGESAIQALVREVEEETGCLVHIGSYDFHTTLVGADRDPRGDQVSLVYKVAIDTKQAKGEVGKTEIFRTPNEKSALPPADTFAFKDHAAVIIDQAA